jgi:hypothetical protein
MTDQQLYARNRVGALAVFVSPWTPMYGASAFLYHPEFESNWADRLDSQPPDLLVTHAPLRLHLDQ